MDLKIRDFEIQILRQLRAGSTSFLDTFMQVITILGEKVVLIVILSFIYFIYDKKIAQKIAYGLFTNLLINNTIKGLVKYPRPFIYDKELDSIRKETATGYSFPSGHSQNAAALYSSIALNSKLERKTFLSKSLLWLIAMIIILLVGFSRLYLAVHYPKDVIIGIILGLAITFICSYLYDKCHGNFKKELCLYTGTLFIFLPFVSIFYTSNQTDLLLLKDFYVAFSLFAGFILAFIIDEKFVRFTCNTSLKKKLLRLLGAGIFCVIIQFGLKLVLPSTVIFSAIRYFLLTFVTLGFYPFIFRKKLFKD